MSWSHSSSCVVNLKAAIPESTTRRFLLPSLSLSETLSRQLDQSYKFDASFCTLPTMLYRLLKNVNQSSSTFFSLSPKSSHSGLQSSSFNDDCASALDASLPVKTTPRRYRSVKNIHGCQMPENNVCSRGSRPRPAALPSTLRRAGRKHSGDLGP